MNLIFGAPIKGFVRACTYRIELESTQHQSKVDYPSIGGCLVLILELIRFTTPTIIIVRPKRSALGLNQNAHIAFIESVLIRNPCVHVKRK